jgi:hypothetical protein
MHISDYLVRQTINQIVTISNRRSMDVVYKYIYGYIALIANPSQTRRLSLAIESSSFLCVLIKVM